MKKTNSTNSINESFLFKTCELNSALSMISGRWKSQIVYCISKGQNRFTLLKKELPMISEQVLGRQLHDLEVHGILIKGFIPNSVPAGIKYILTAKGLAVVPILISLCEWGKQYQGECIGLISKTN